MAKHVRTCIVELSLLADPRLSVKIMKSSEEKSKHIFVWSNESDVTKNWGWEGHMEQKHRFPVGNLCFRESFVDTKESSLGNEKRDL